MGCVRDKTILVTGGAGAIGSNLVKRLARSKRKKIVVLDNLSSGYRKNITSSGNIVFIKGDITNNRDLKSVFSHDISLIFHLAAHFANQNSVDHPEKDLLTNVLGTLKLLEYSVKKKVRKFVYASTSCVYGHKEIALKEDFLDFKHDTPYSISKLMGEEYVTFFNRHYGLKTCVLRYFNAYGPGEMPGPYRNVIPNFIFKAMEGKPLPITGTGNETRDFTYVDDIVSTTIKAAELESANGLIFNVASGVQTKIIDLAEKINKLTKNKGGVIFLKKRKWDNILKRSADTERAREILGHKITVSLDEGLRKTYKWLKGNVKVRRGTLAS